MNKTYQKCETVVIFWFYDSNSLLPHLTKPIKNANLSSYLSWGCLGAVLGLSWGCLGLSWGSLGAVSGLSWGFWGSFGALGAVLGSLGAVLGYLGAVLGLSRTLVGLSWPLLGLSWALLGLLGAVLGCLGLSWGCLGSLGAASGANTLEKLLLSAILGVLDRKNQHSLGSSQQPEQPTASNLWPRSAAGVA